MPRGVYDHKRRNNRNNDAEFINFEKRCHDLESQNATMTADLEIEKDRCNDLRERIHELEAQLLILKEVILDGLSTE